ncbi:diamine N-acetyltransferase [Bacillus pakistanensis]|uniref:Diamine N-acetyltransferase n=1 Tax=Rossellomorea pakistanensis TaxID=992288 RepID=A0ABS2N783_9BACI|nr:GNAT family N-acetyltransferase [Bacillus pakistanensis]MBM7583679.1 diamine N-acetyltransferase [Bacillus pakistanensis]
MNVQLKVVTRQNWEEALTLEVEQHQSKFVPTVAVSLAKVYIKPDGENIEYIPFAIYDQEEMVGFIMHAFDESTSNMYWINGLIIDKKFQGKGYGKAALTEVVRWISNKFTQCKEIRLTVYRENYTGINLYKNFGFVPTGEVYGDEDVWRLIIK